MMTPEFEVRVGKQPWGALTGIAIFQNKGGKVFLARPVELIFDELKEGKFDVKPTFSVPDLYLPQLAHAMAEALDRHNVKTESDHKLAGTLEAQKHHLEDLRALLRLKK